MAANRPNVPKIPTSIAWPFKIYPNCDFWSTNLATLFGIATKVILCRQWMSSGHSFIASKIALNTGLPDFSWYKIPKREKCTKLPQNITNVYKIVIPTKRP
jgi:hypothetical protein